MDSSHTGSSVPGILQAGILEWVAISSFRQIKASEVHSMAIIFNLPKNKGHLKKWLYMYNN